VWIVDAFCSELSGNIRCALGIRVRDGQPFDERISHQAARVESANPARADETHVHRHAPPQVALPAANNGNVPTGTFPPV
jgi:hypothetical protein